MPEPSDSLDLETIAHPENANNGSANTLANPTLLTKAASSNVEQGVLSSKPRGASHPNSLNISPARPSAVLVVLGAIAILITGWILNNLWLELAGTLVAFVVSLRIVAPTLSAIVSELLSQEEKINLIATGGLLIATVGGLKLLGVDRKIGAWLSQANWDAVGALGEVFGALGQILIAVLAVYIAWRQYVIEKDLTTQQNRITQQQTIDSYFQGISDLVLDEEGLLEDWPQERAIAAGRTAAILGSIDAEGKAKVIRFLSCARLLSPLRRDNRLGRAILDGSGGYQEDRAQGIRVIDLGIMLARADLSKTDLRWTDLSEVNLIRANLSGCDLVKANFCRTILYEANLRNADLNGTRFFYGNAETASPRSRTDHPNYKTGEFTGAVVENANLTNVEDLSEEQRYYCCAWGGAKTRATIPGGCEGIPNKLGR
ncbi:MAG: pentapeptide repeat-containing protein [Scytolyngbya sp. HA4215-MV1]|nr:pentapeptide repeat-containing protein [Scytolyngbya sp. HA4215-MV1]